jgi:hypothetical protein
MAAKCDPLAPLWALLSGTPLRDDHERIGHELDRLRWHVEQSATTHGKIANRCKALGRLVTTSTRSMAVWSFRTVQTPRPDCDAGKRRIDPQRPTFIA